MIAVSLGQKFHGSLLIETLNRIESLLRQKHFQSNTQQDKCTLNLAFFPKLSIYQCTDPSIRQRISIWNPSQASLECQFKLQDGLEESITSLFGNAGTPYRELVARSDNSQSNLTCLKMEFQHYHQGDYDLWIGENGKNLLVVVRHALEKEVLERALLDEIGLFGRLNGGGDDDLFEAVVYGKFDLQYLRSEKFI